MPWRIDEEDGFPDSQPELADEHGAIGSPDTHGHDGAIRPRGGGPSPLPYI